jgi:transcriptional regulator with XRE-family HTH domain
VSAVLTNYNESYIILAMRVLTDIRKQRGISQRALAHRAAVSFRGLQLLEKSGHNWRIKTVSRVAGALNLPRRGVNLVVDQFLRMRPDSIQEISIRMMLDGFESWKIHLFDFVDAFRATRHCELLDPPVTGLDIRLQALCATVVEALCAENGLRAPPWCAGIPPLSQPWFVAGIENLKASALVESPAWFRSRNIFVLGNFLSRA